MDSPRGFFDNSWLAVERGSVDAISKTLELSELRTVTWSEGLNAVCGDFWDAELEGNAALSRVFITPEVSGWRLAVGGWLGGDGGRRATATICSSSHPGPIVVPSEEGGVSLDEIARYCRELSATFGAAHAFTEQGRMDWYQWILASGGVIQRLYCWNGKALRDEGDMPEVERRIHERDGTEEGWEPNTGDVGAIAGHYSIDPDLVDLSTPSVGVGFLGTTRWGRDHGVPKRDLRGENR